MPQSEGHLYAYHLGNPGFSPEFTIQGHISLNLQASSKLIFRAIDKSWTAHAELASFDFPTASTINISLSVTDIKGVSPFGGSISFGPVAIDVILKDIVGTVANVAFFIAVNEPPVPPQV